jgi:hypothetical protein
VSKSSAALRADLHASDIPEGVRGPQMDTELRLLFHRLNNQLGIILAHAELLEAKGADDVTRARAAQVVTSILDAMGTAREIRRRTEADAPV